MGYRFQDVNGNASPQEIAAQVNKTLRALDKESVVKVFKGQNNTESLVIGRYKDDRYGLLLYDSSGVPVILIGQAPDDARMGIWQAKPGQNVITLLGG